MDVNKIFDPLQGAYAVWGEYFATYMSRIDAGLMVVMSPADDVLQNYRQSSSLSKLIHEAIDCLKQALSCNFILNVFPQKPSK